MKMQMDFNFFKIQQKNFFSYNKVDGDEMFLIENLIYTLQLEPHAYARIKGANIAGMVKFYQTNLGVIVACEVQSAHQKENNRILGFHIHNGESCSGDAQNPFKNALGHYNPKNTLHPYHAGDLPPLFENNGYVLSVFLTSRFTVKDIIHKTIIIHDRPDDFTSQPSGNAGNMIACGQIKRGNP